MPDENKQTPIADIQKEVAKAKPLYKSRTVGILVAILTVFISRWMAKHVDAGWAHDIAEAVASDIVGYVMAAATLFGVWVKKQDYKKVQNLLDLYESLKEEHNKALTAPVEDAKSEDNPSEEKAADKPADAQ